MKKIKTIAISSRQTVALTALIPLLVVAGIVLYNATSKTAEVGLYPWELIIMYALTVLIHEFVHGIGFRIVGAKPAFGAGVSGMMPYAFTTSKDMVSVKAMIFIGCLPFLSLSIIFPVLSYTLPSYQAWFYVGFLANLGGSVGDLWIVSKLYGYRKRSDYRVLDNNIGVDIYSKN